MCRAGLACSDCPGLSGSIHFAESIMLVFTWKRLIYGLNIPRFTRVACSYCGISVYFVPLSIVTWAGRFVYTLSVQTPHSRLTQAAFDTLLGFTAGTAYPVLNATLIAYVDTFIGANC